MTETLAAPAADTFPRAIATAVREAATEFFSSSCGLTHVDRPREQDETPRGGLMSTISFRGDPSWTFAMVLSDEAAVMVAQAFAGFEIPVDSPDMGDVLGEIVNVVAGGICARLDAKGIKAQMSLPSVIRGENVALLAPSGCPSTHLTFAGPKGRCWFRLVTARDGVLGRRSGA